MRIVKITGGYKFNRGCRFALRRTRLALAWFLGFCCLQAASAAPSKPEAVATVGMVADIVREVAGDHWQVRSLLGEGTDPHQYTPTRGDLIALDRAQAIFYNGLLLEGRMTDILQRMARRGKPVFAVAAAIRDSGNYPLLLEGDETDPHLWMDVGAWMLATRQVAGFLAELDPANAEDYHANAEVYLAALRQLDDYVREVIATIPQNQRVLVTAHDAFGYFGRAYGIEVLGIQGLSTDSEAGVRDIEDRVRFIMERQIPAVFIESSVPDRNVRALVEGVRARGRSLSIGGELFSDAMGRAGTYEGTYIGMIDHNATTITRALGGEAPLGGLHNRLAAVTK